MLSVFSCLLAICTSSLEKCLFSSLALFFDWVVYFSGVGLQELRLILCQLLHLLLFFSHSEGCLFTLLIVLFILTFYNQKYLNICDFQNNPCFFMLPCPCLCHFTYQRHLYTPFIHLFAWLIAYSLRLSSHYLFWEDFLLDLTPLLCTPFSIIHIYKPPTTLYCDSWWISLPSRVKVWLDGCLSLSKCSVIRKYWGNEIKWWYECSVLILGHRIPEWWDVNSTWVFSLRDQSL